MPHRLSQRGSSRRPVLANPTNRLLNTEHPRLCNSIQRKILRNRIGGLRELPPSPGRICSRKRDLIGRGQLLPRGTFVHNTVSKTHPWRRRRVARAIFKYLVRLSFCMDADTSQKGDYGLYRLVVTEGTGKASIRGGRRQATVTLGKRTIIITEKL
ncbi:hypothetical protein GQ53DRAFT_97003 [Thozetella sp. PMI_491]|nr:hypothetical protein GQ53DRAFT_97003 [Thozetella sp. PMI_491]